MLLFSYVLAFILTKIFVNKYKPNANRDRIWSTFVNSLTIVASTLKMYMPFDTEMCFFFFFFPFLGAED
jgi:hypothetical protein